MENRKAKPRIIISYCNVDDVDDVEALDEGHDFAKAVKEQLMEELNITTGSIYLDNINQRELSRAKVKNTKKNLTTKNNIKRPEENKVTETYETWKLAVKDAEVIVQFQSKNCLNSYKTDVAKISDLLKNREKAMNLLIIPINSNGEKIVKRTIVSAAAKVKSRYLLLPDCKMKAGSGPYDSELSPQCLKELTRRLAKLLQINT